jgi:hypothetical protein
MLTDSLALLEYRGLIMLREKVTTKKHSYLKDSVVPRL